MIKKIVPKGTKQEIYTNRQIYKSSGAKWNGEYWVFAIKPDGIDTETIYFPENVAEVEAVVIEITNEIREEITKEVIERLFDMSNGRATKEEIFEQNKYSIENKIRKIIATQIKLPEYTFNEEEKIVTMYDRLQELTKPIPYDEWR